MKPSNYFSRTKKTFFVRFFTIAYIISLFSIIPAFAQSQSSDTETEVRRLISRAKTAYNAGYLEEALKEYTKAQKIVPKLPDLYKAIGSIHEQLGSEENLNSAIENYNTYLYLSPEASDKNVIVEKIASLEYTREKQIERNIILDNLSGYWVSNLVLASNEKKQSVIFQIEEIQRTGKYSLTIQPESGIYRESIIQKTVNLIPTENLGFRFTLGDSKTYTPSNNKWHALRIGVSALGGSKLSQELMQTGVSVLQETDLPNNTQTVYEFDLNYKDGDLVGLLSVVQNYSDQRESKNTFNEMYEISFTKVDDLYGDIKLKALGYYSQYGRQLDIKTVESLLEADTDAYNLYMSGKKQQKPANILGGIGGGLLGAGFSLYMIVWLDDKENPMKDKTKKNLKKWGAIGLGSAAALLISMPIINNKAVKKQKAAIDLYNQNRKDLKETSDWILNAGITCSGGVGLVFNF